MKKVLWLLCLLGTTVFGQEFNLTLHLTDGTTVTIPIDDIRRLDFDGVTGIDDGEDTQQVISEFKLLQNYPNPFNPTTTIAYQLPVTVSIFDISGKLIKVLLSETQAGGTHQVVWDGTNQNNSGVSSGIYIYAVRSGNSVLAKQMLLIK